MVELEAFDDWGGPPERDRCIEIPLLGCVRGKVIAWGCEWTDVKLPDDVGRFLDMVIAHRGRGFDACGYQTEDGFIRRVVAGDELRLGLEHSTGVTVKEGDWICQLLD